MQMGWTCILDYLYYMCRSCIATGTEGNREPIRLKIQTLHQNVSSTFVQKHLSQLDLHNAMVIVIQIAIVIHEHLHSNGKVLVQAPC